MRKHLNRTKFLSGAALVAALFCFSGDAMAQSSRELSNRLTRLENELETLSRAIYRGEQPPVGTFSGGGDPGAAANAEVRFQQLDVQIRDLTGKIEEQNFEIRQLKDTLERLNADVELRLGALERGNAGGEIDNSSAPSSRSFDNPVTSSPSSTRGNVLGTISESGSNAVSSSSSDSAAAIYENAFSLLKNGNYDSAEREFDSFLRNHGDHALAANAKYWLGETYYVRGDFERAARIFAESYQQYPKSAKAADSLLKLGLSLASSGNTKDACVALNQLKKENPDGLGPVGRRAEQEATRLGC
jgi:tol-pal system protein YbgF